ncbi:hypothetical protein DFH08DRAFT_810344 [Mycena albidolilacea]|uniref:Uncharacterized protein n=1 Tax=Mycena albidolilacea TaxID=1033008 RepID=A0AAD7EQJ6_9AGAR|nr:hypothetical protein DFH08DRAFT_810344 [Mycena albidolilacea]
MSTSSHWVAECSNIQDAKMSLELSGASQSRFARGYSCRNNDVPANIQARAEPKIGTGEARVRGGQILGRASENERESEGESERDGGSDRGSDEGSGTNDEPRHCGKWNRIRLRRNQNSVRRTRRCRSEWKVERNVADQWKKMGLALGTRAYRRNEAIRSTEWAKNAPLNITLLLPTSKKSVQDRLNRLKGRLPLPKKAIKRVASIALSPVKNRLQKKRRNKDPENADPEPNTANSENHDVFLNNTNPPAADYHTGRLYQGSRPEPPEAAPMAFVIQGKIGPTECESPHHDNDHASIRIFPTLCAPSLLAESDSDDHDLDNEIVPPELDELCAVEAGAFGGDRYPHPVPPKSFIEKMAGLWTKQILAVAPDIATASAALTDIQLVLQGPTKPRVYCFGRKQSMLADKDLANNVHEHFQELEKFITADNPVDYLSREDMMNKHSLDKNITVHTAQRYLNDLGYQPEKKGQYSDGHEHNNVVYYREEVYLLTLKGFQDHSCIFEADGSVITPTLPVGVR